MTRLPVLETPGDPWVAIIASFSRLKEGWNGSRAPAPAPPAIDWASRFASALAASGLPPTRVAPSAVGGVAVTRRAGTRKVLVEFFNDGAANALFADDTAEQMQTHRVVPTPEGFEEVIGKVREYLDG